MSFKEVPFLWVGLLLMGLGIVLSLWLSMTAPRTHKPCAHCREQIRIEATKCAECMEWQPGEGPISSGSAAGE